MKILLSHFWLSIILIFSVPALQAAPKGDLLYAQHCSSCHGEEGDGGVGVPLSLPSFLDSVSDQYLHNTIRLGRPGRIMPAFELLSDAQLSAIVRHIRSWSDKPAPEEDNSTIVGNNQHGQKIFEERCVQCHGEDGRGGKGTGVTLSRKRDLPIIAPALNNAGFLASASDTLIRDTIAFGRAGTPMVSMLKAGLTQSDINDVVAYIRSFEETSKVLQSNLDKKFDEPPVISAESPYTMKETIENIKQSITDQNFTWIRTEYLDHGLVPDGKEDKSKVIIHFCNFKFLFEALTVDPRAGMFLPCRITLVEKEGVVTVSTINPKRLSKLFNNHELEDYCDEMYEVYSTLVEDATL